MLLLVVSIAEAVYLSYTFHFLKTSVDFNVLGSPSNLFFKHAIGNAKVCRICPFGQYAILGLIALLVLRSFVNVHPKYVPMSVALALFLSLINLNALVDLIPVVLAEGCLYYSQPNGPSY